MSHTFILAAHRDVMSCSFEARILLAYTAKLDQTSTLKWLSSCTTCSLLNAYGLRPLVGWFFMYVAAAPPMTRQRRRINSISADFGSSSNQAVGCSFASTLQTSHTTT
jgi:hypothetical protein